MTQSERQVTREHLAELGQQGGGGQQGGQHGGQQTNR
jgi:hypothetical protein